MRTGKILMAKGVAEGYEGEGVSFLEVMLEYMTLISIRDGVNGMYELRCKSPHFDDIQEGEEEPYYNFAVGDMRKKKRVWLGRADGPYKEIVKELPIVDKIY